jgi:hypothetical protein
MTNEEFQALVASRVSERPFKPMSIYDPDEDKLEFLVANESYREQRIDSCLTVYYGRETREIIGAVINGFTKFLKPFGERVDRVQLEIRNGKVKLVQVFDVAMQHSKAKHPNITVVLVLEKLRKVAEDNDLEANIGNLACSNN